MSSHKEHGGTKITKGNRKNHLHLDSDSRLKVKELPT